MKYISTNKEKRSKWTSLSFFILIIIAGIITGSVMHKPLLGSRLPHFNTFESCSAVSNIKNTFFVSVFYICSAFIVGSSVIGQPFAYALLFNCGTAVGSCTFMMYKLYGKGAVIPIILTVLPKAVSISSVTVLAVRAALRSSAALFCAYRDGDVRDSRDLDIKLYCTRYIVLILLSLFFSAAASALDLLYHRIGRL
jgi:hypothetical protein